MSQTFREGSKLNWIPATGINPSDEQLKVGCLQRIADATEVMARNYSALVDERNRYKKWYEESCIREDKLSRRVSALRGVVTRMKASK